MPQVEYYTPEMVRALPDDGKRYETVHGELLVTPSPGIPHQRVVGRLHAVLWQYLEKAGLEGLLTSPADVSFDDDTLVQPDLFVADGQELDRAARWTDLKTFHLMIEILSPSSVRADRFTKRRLYQEQGIPVYWVVDIDRRQVEVWTPEAHFPIIEREQLVWRHPALDEECRIDLEKLFPGSPTPSSS